MRFVPQRILWPYLRAVAANGTRVADATASRIKLTAASAYVTVGDMGAAMGSAGQATIKIQPIWDGTNSIFAINPASAIA